MYKIERHVGYVPYPTWLIILLFKGVYTLVLSTNINTCWYSMGITCTTIEHILQEMRILLGLGSGLLEEKILSCSSVTSSHFQREGAFSVGKPVPYINNSTRKTVHKTSFFNKHVVRYSRIRWYEECRRPCNTFPNAIWFQWRIVLQGRRHFTQHNLKRKRYVRSIHVVRYF